jgi:alkyl hydroperoxide reductase subunit AhpC
MLRCDTKESFMALRIGDTAPDFEGESTQGLLRFHGWKAGAWAVFFAHPQNFTPVCTTEIGEAARLESEFAARNARLIGLSVDDLAHHAEWLADIAAATGHKVRFPLIADADHAVSHLYDMLSPSAAGTRTVRNVFLIDPANKVRLILTYPNAIGRNFHEILRTLDALQLSDAHPVVTPVNWHPGEDVIVDPALTDDAALRARFPAGVRTELSYLRRAAQPAPVEAA